MNRTPRKTETPTKNNRLTSRSPQTGSKASLSQSKDNLTQDTYFCHYKNAMYMGAVKVFQKDGRGIILHDDGSSAITSYEKDMLHGYNLVLSPEGALISVQYNKNKLVDIAYKNQRFLFYGRYQNEQLDGPATLVNYQDRQIVYVNTKKGQVQEKTQQKSEIQLSKLFEVGSLQGLLPQEHIKCLAFQIARTKDMQIMRRGGKVTVGFMKNGFLNGLAFSVALHANNKQCLHDLDAQLIERGYYKNGQLSGMGERRFRNGNVYLGQFKNNEFQGVGILKNNQKKNWVSGQFERGNLIELGKYSNDGTEKNTLKILESIHQRKTSWVSKDVSLANSAYFQNQIQKIQKFKNNEQLLNLEVKRQEMLKRIQDNFIVEGDEEAREAHVSIPHGMSHQSPLEKYLKLQVPNTTYKNYDTIKEETSKEEKRLDSSRKNRIFLDSKDGSFRQKMIEGSRIQEAWRHREKEDLPKYESYHMEVYPVPVDDSFTSRKSEARDERKLKTEATQFQPQLPPFRDSKTLVGPAALQKSEQRMPDRLERSNVSRTQTHNRSTFSNQKADRPPLDNNGIYERRFTRSPYSVMQLQSMQKRKQDIIEAMYRRDVKRHLF